MYTVAQEQRALASLMLFEHALLEEERDLRASLGLGGNDIAVLRLVTDAEAEGHLLTPSDIARTLGTSSAATTVALASAPFSCPPMPSATAQRPISGRRMKLSSLAVRTLPVWLMQPVSKSGFRRGASFMASPS